MLRKRFVIHRPDKKRKHRRISFIVSNILLLLGTLVLVSSLMYLLLNLDQSDALINLTMPFIIAGIGLLIVSQLICPFQFKFRR